MSRCFPFPPSGFTKNLPCAEALIESIKLHNESKNAKKDRKKEKRREKKEKREERKEKDATASRVSDAKEFKLLELEKSIGCVQKGDDYENEQLERSDITEEHDQPVSSQKPCCSDSTHSSKRKRSTSPSSQYHGTGVKIRLSLRKHIDPEKSKLEGQLGSTSRTRSVGAADSFAHRNNGNDHPLPCVTNAEKHQCSGNSDSRHYKELQSLPHGAAPTTNLLDDEGKRMVSVYSSLFQNWVPPQHTIDGFNSEDQDWLFSSKLQEERPVSKKVKAATGALQCSAASLWPRAHYLPEVETYVLPYAVPF